MKRLVHHLRTKEATFHPSVFLLTGIFLGFLAVFFSVKMTVVQGVSSSTVTSQVNSGGDDVTEDGTSYDETGSQIFIGNGQSTSYTGLRFTNITVPKGASILSATLDFYPTSQQWIGLSLQINGENTSNASSFSSSSKPSTRTLTSASVSHHSNKKWDANQWVTLDDIKPIVQEIVNRSDWTAGNSIAVIMKGTGSQWARKFVSSIEGGNGAKLTIAYTGSTSTIPTTTLTPSPVPATPTSVPSLTPTNVPATPTPTIVSTTLSLTPTPTGTPLTSLEYGTWTPKTTGLCSKEIHDSYFVIGPDGKKYSTWHPPVDPATGCKFDHEHGDDPRTSKVDPSMPAFGYAAEAAGMFEPHTGFKVYVANAGQVNDEGRTNLHNARFVFHMGTGGPKRFTTQFHSMEYKVITNDGRKMFVQGMADIGKVGTICNDPREQRTVMGFGCLLDSPYEIWENKLTITNNDQTLAQAISSTAVFDSITVMDPADLTRTVYVWDPEAQSKIFKFNDPRDSYRGCNREAYFGPTYWYGSSNTVQTYYTDAYGKVTPGGPLKQEIGGTSTNGFVATNDGLSQFKYHKSQCVPGLGLSN